MGTIVEAPDAAVLGNEFLQLAISEPWNWGCRQVTGR